MAPNKRLMKDLSEDQGCQIISPEKKKKNSKMEWCVCITGVNCAFNLVGIKTFRGQVTKPTTVKWSIEPRQFWNIVIVQMVCVSCNLRWPSLYLVTTLYLHGKLLFKISGNLKQIKLYHSIDSSWWQRCIMGHDNLLWRAMSTKPWCQLQSSCDSTSFWGKCLCIKWLY